MAEKWLLECLNGTKKLYLTHGHLDTVRKGKPLKEVALKLRVYLTCPVLSYRDALASVVFSTHKLAVERLRWVDHGRPTVARHCRLCRLCEGTVETPEHALLQCDSSAMIIQLWQDFLEKVWSAHPQAVTLYRMGDPMEFLRWLLGQEKIVLLLGKFTYRVLQEFYSYPLYRP
ncbi:hypothetical protein EV421DRAFT_2091199 [Armillaria borealis]|uniref:Uncharacterized protein n=1 Tax=Armillaria borealis TaxID=47425 RepID=A0AA39IT85_9AGAR|nr:hypothetical protein EV421DRAFT_2091199 [Armillaria borealis]